MPPSLRDEACPDEDDIAAFLAALVPRTPARRDRMNRIGAILVMAATAAAAGGHAIHLRRAAEDRAVLVGRLRGLAPEVSTQSPRRAVDDALVEYETAARMNATRADAWAGMSDALAVYARFQRRERDDITLTLTRARTALARALAIDASFEPAIRYRIMLAELDAEAVLERSADPTAAVRQMRADAQQLLRRLPDDGVAHWLACRAELLAARWALAHHAAVDRLLAIAAYEAARARDGDAMDALAWIASAEVEQLRGEAARARGLALNAAIVARGWAFIERALAIDPRLGAALAVRDELTRLQRLRHEAASR